MKSRYYLLLLSGILLPVCWSSCSNNKGPLAVFKKLSPHDQYGQRLKDAGLDKTAMGNAWLLKAGESISKALEITLPYKETGYFSADKVMSAVWRFDAKRGENIHVEIVKKPLTGFTIYTDLLQLPEGYSYKVVAFADTGVTLLNYEVKKNRTIHFKVAF